ncbi:hypothetical protein SBA4_2010032 [Candidatus Sulfopaludibacter sp. SbA4]|nr:hypothetical protein SBA4_2010032 [Candidatus Sulfopaludibacter sp. SbA4]
MPFTVSTTGRLLFLSCFMKSPERRRNVVSDWMSLVMSNMEAVSKDSTFLGAVHERRRWLRHPYATILSAHATGGGHRSDHPCGHGEAVPSVAGRTTRRNLALVAK